MMGMGDVSKALAGLEKTQESMEYMVKVLENIQTLISEQNEILRDIRKNTLRVI